MQLSCILALPIRYRYTISGGNIVAARNGTRNNLILSSPVMTSIISTFRDEDNCSFWHRRANYFIGKPNKGLLLLLLLLLLSAFDVINCNVTSRLSLYVA